MGTRWRKKAEIDKRNNVRKFESDVKTCTHAVDPCQGRKMIFRMSSWSCNREECFFFRIDQHLIKIKMI
jgi:hypothetical protein